MHTMWDYLIELGSRMSENALRDIDSLSTWEKVRHERRREFLEMVGLDPLPGNVPLNPTIHGTAEGDGYTIHRISLESIPKVYVTCTLYVPNGLTQPAPAVLYVCGHGMIGTVHYQAHGDLWARRGYVCIMPDTLEQGDNRGDHHGIYSAYRNDWYDRGYAASGGELWDSLRALDYLCSRHDVDPSRVGVTGISGGGALSWWVGIADERVRAIAPVCGTSSMASHISERTLNGHCDCMLYHNLYEREMSEVGALCAPRPLLVGAAREDSLFYPPAYRQVVEQIRKIYRFYGKPGLCELCEYPGPHAYSDEVVERIQLWFDQHVAGWEKPTVKLHAPAFEEPELTVFAGAPPVDDRIHLLPDLLFRPGRIRHRDTVEEWQDVRREKVAELRAKVFRHFPKDPEPLDVEEVGDWEYGGGTQLLIRDYVTEHGIRLRARIVVPEKSSGVILVGLMQPEDRAETFQGQLMGTGGGCSVCVVEPRGTGPTSWHASQDWQMLRGAALVGRTPASMQVWDLLRAIEMIVSLDDVPFGRLFTYGKGRAAALAIYAGLLDDRVSGVLADSPPASHAEGPHLLNVLRVLDIPEAAGLIAPHPLGLVSAPARPFYWAQRVYDRLGVSEKLIQGSDPKDVFRRLREQ